MLCEEIAQDLAMALAVLNLPGLPLAVGFTKLLGRLLFVRRRKVELPASPARRGFMCLRLGLSPLSNRLLPVARCCRLGALAPRSRVCGRDGSP